MLSHLLICFSFSESYIGRSFNSLLLLCSVLDCHPQVSDAKKMIEELNITNGLYSFVRTMRAKFQEVAAGGNGSISDTSYCYTLSL